jgi:hypothetical protein
VTRTTTDVVLAEQVPQVNPLPVVALERLAPRPLHLAVLARGPLQVALR